MTGISLNVQPHSYKEGENGLCTSITQESWGPYDVHNVEYCGLEESHLAHDTELVSTNDFACSCSDEGKKRCDRIRKWALDYLKATPEDFLTKAVHSLNWDYGATIEGILNDMWSRIDIKQWNHPKDEEPFNVSITCDRVEDGLAFALKVYHQKYGDHMLINEE